MKYLKSINEHNNSEFLDDLKDILFELKDIGFEANLNVTQQSYQIVSGDTEKKIHILIFESGESLKSKKKYKSNFTDEVIDSIIRLNDYVKSKGNWHTNYFIKQLGESSSIKFYVKGDRLRTQDIRWIDDKWPDFSYLELEFFRI